MNNTENHTLTPEELLKKDTFKVRIKAGLVVLAIVLGIGLLFSLVPQARPGWIGGSASAFETKYEKDIYVRFGMEVYDIISDNYWQEVNETELSELFRLSFEKASGSSEALLRSKNRAGVARMLASGLKGIEESKKKSLIIDTSIIALNNLYPAGRSGLLSDTEEEKFRDSVGNINRDKNLYSIIGTEEGAGIEEIILAYEEKKAILEKDDSEEAKLELEQLAYAHDVLTDNNTKSIYDETKMEPSVTSRITENGVLYLDMRNITPATFQEIAGKLEGINESNRPSGIILDLRGNVGGALDFARFLFALFVGPNQYAYDLFHKGELEVERTPAISKVESLDDVEDIAILTDGSTQSTAELMASIFKRFNRAKVVGTQTLGWGTVENTFPVSTVFDDKEKYSVLLVHSLTVRDDGESIETNGVDPDIDISLDNWRSEITSTFGSGEFSRDLIEIVGEEL